MHSTALGGERVPRNRISTTEAFQKILLLRCQRASVEERVEPKWGNERSKQNPRSVEPWNHNTIFTARRANTFVVAPVFALLYYQEQITRERKGDELGSHHVRCRSAARK